LCKSCGPNKIPFDYPSNSLLYLPEAGTTYTYGVASTPWPADGSISAGNRQCGEGALAEYDQGTVVDDADGNPLPGWFACCKNFTKGDGKSLSKTPSEDQGGDGKDRTVRTTPGLRR
jgi:hypothetical protein